MCDTPFTMSIAIGESSGRGGGGTEQRRGGMRALLLIFGGIRCVRSSNQPKIADIVVSKPNSVHPSAIVTHHTLLRFVMLCAGLGAQ